MPRMSSTIRMPKIIPAKRSLLRPSSSSALMMIVVEDIARIAPRKMAFTFVQPKSRPASYPSHPISRISIVAAITAVLPTSASLRRLNSSPSENIRRITPSSESVSIVCFSPISE